VRYLQAIRSGDIGLQLATTHNAQMGVLNELATVVRHQVASKSARAELKASPQAQAQPTVWPSGPSFTRNLSSPPSAPPLAPPFAAATHQPDVAKPQSRQGLNPATPALNAPMALPAMMRQPPQNQLSHSEPPSAHVGDHVEPQVTPIRTALDPAWWNEASPIEGAAQLLVRWQDLGTATPEEVCFCWTA
jgi:hypothetical protein